VTPKTGGKKIAARVIAAPKKREPLKTMRKNTRNVENYLKTDEKWLEDENVNKRIGISFLACQDCVMVIEGKCRSVVIKACKNMTVFVKSCVSEVFAMNCTNLKIHPTTQVKKVSLESSKNVLIHFNNITCNCRVVSTCCRVVLVLFPK
jgi:hypothetical protein